MESGGGDCVLSMFVSMTSRKPPSRLGVAGLARRCYRLVRKGLQLARSQIGEFLCASAKV
jgi:hypothetical protein